MKQNDERDERKEDIVQDPDADTEALTESAADLEIPAEAEEKAVNKFELEARQAREATKKLKKTILIVAAGMVVFMVAALLLMPVLDRAINGTGEEESTARQNTVIYYEPDYEYDIMQDAEYLELDRYIYYTDIRTNETIIIPDDKVASYGPAVVTLKTMIDAIIAGDHETYNSLFSTNYYEADENRKPEPPFTMQQLYDIELTLVSTEDRVEDNKRYTLYVYDVEYKIHKNNGTFRVDLGHDDSRAQRFILSNSTGDRVLIDQIGDFIYKN